MKFRASFPLPLLLPLALCAQSAPAPAPGGEPPLPATPNNMVLVPVDPRDRLLPAKRAQIFLAEERRDAALLAPLLDDADEHLRARAARAAGRIGAPDAPLRLATLLKDPEEKVRAGAAWGALYLGEPARPLLPALRELAKQPGAARLPAIETIISLNEEADADWLIEMLARDPSLQAAYTGHLFRMDRPKVRLYLKLWSRNVLDASGSYGALYSLLRLKVEDEPLYRELAAQSTGAKRMLALRGLGLAKAPAPESLALIEAAANDPRDAIARTEAIGLLVKFRGPAAEPAAGALAAARARGDIQTQLRVYDALPDEACAAGLSLPAIAAGVGAPANSEMAEPLLIPRDLPQSLLRRLVAKAAGCAKPEIFAAEAGNLYQVLLARRPDQVRARIALADALAARPELPGDLLTAMAAERDPRMRASAGAALITRGGDPAPWLLDGDLAVVEAAAGTANDLLKDGKAPRVTGKLLGKAYAKIEKRPEGGSARLYLARAAAACAAKDAACKALLLRAIRRDRDRAVQLDAWGRWPAALAGRPPWPQPNLPPPDFIAAEHRLGSLIDAVPRFAVETTKGKFVMAFDARGDSPVNVLNFRALAAKRYFDGIAWHRVVPNIVVQGGDPRGDGSGGPGWMIPCEYNSYPYIDGAVGMALDGKDTGGSQFFVALTRVPHLDYKYTVLGHVESGMEVVYQLGEDDTIVSIREIAP